MTNKLENIFQEILKINKDNLSDLNRKNCPNWDSLNHINLISSIEKEFNIEFTIEDLLKLNSFEEILFKVKEYVNK